MAIKYDFYKSPSPDGTDKGFHVRTLSGTALSKDSVKQYIQDSCSLTSADISGCLDALVQLFSTSFMMGRSVHLDGLGTFSARIGGKVVENARGDLQLKDGYVKGIQFKPDASLMRRLHSTELVCAHERGQYPTARSEEEIIAALKDYFITSDHISTQNFYLLSGLSRSKSFSTLRSFTEKGILSRESYGVYVRGEALKA